MLNKENMRYSFSNMLNFLLLYFLFLNPSIVSAPLHFTKMILMKRMCTVSGYKVSELIFFLERDKWSYVSAEVKMINTKLCA